MDNETELEQKQEKSLLRTLEILIEQQDKTNANAVHFKMEDVFNTKGRSVVISVYKDIQPSNVILDKVYEYAQGNDPQLVEYINDLEEGKRF